MEKKRHRKKVWKYIVGTIILFLAALIHCITHWVIHEFGVLDFNTIVYHMKTDLGGANVEPFLMPIFKSIIIALIVALAGCFATRFCKSSESIVVSIHKFEISYPFDFWQRYYVVGTIIILFVVFIFNSSKIGITKYVLDQMFPSKLFEKEYVPPQETTLTFPKEKRNLIYIFMESMENTFSSEEHGGASYDNFIPGLTELQLENVNFSNSNEKLNGFYVPYGSSFTSAAIISQTSGVPILSGNIYETGKILPGAYSIGQILEKEGYNQTFLIGSDKSFAQRDKYMTQHGNYDIIDYYYAIEAGWIPLDYHVFWGYEDKRLFENAKNELLKLSKENKPFNLTMLTVDTHYPNGYVCELCDDAYANDPYANVYACSDRQLCEFINWIKTQDFYENTTIVLVGDHFTMNEQYRKEMMLDNEGYEATVYTAIINATEEYSLDYTRIYTSFDLFPTTLAAMGVKIEGDRLGLGTNLFADTPTIAEKYGMKYINEELAKVSKYYQNNILNVSDGKKK